MDDKITHTAPWKREITGVYRSKKSRVRREFKSRPDLGFMVAQDRFKSRFKISALRHDYQPFPENVPETSLKEEFKAQLA